MTGMTMQGGLRLWFLTTTRSVLEGASATHGTQFPEDPSFLRHDLYRMLDYLDGSVFVQQDVPVGTLLSVDPHTVQVPLLLSHALRPTSSKGLGSKVCICWQPLVKRRGCR